MKQFKKIAALLLAAAMMLSLLTACGGGSSSPLAERNILKIIEAAGVTGQSGNPLRAEAAKVLQSVGSGGRISDPSKAEYTEQNDHMFLTASVITESGSSTQASPLPWQITKWDISGMNLSQMDEVAELRAIFARMDAVLASANARMTGFGVATKTIDGQTYWAMAIKAER